MKFLKNRPLVKLGQSLEMAKAKAIDDLEILQKYQENPNFILKYCKCKNKHFVLNENDEPSCICSQELPKGKMFHLCQSNHRTVIDSYIVFKAVKCVRCKEIQEYNTKIEEKKLVEARKEYNELNNNVKIPGFKTPEIFAEEIKAKILAKAIVDEQELRKK